jgi:hypothetical protein
LQNRAPVPRSRTATMQENWDDEIIDRMAVADPFRIPIGTGSIPPSYQSVHNLHTRAFQCLQQNNLSQAFQYEHEALQQLLTVFHTDKTGRHVPILLVVTSLLLSILYQIKFYNYLSSIIIWFHLGYPIFKESNV